MNQTTYRPLPPEFVAAAAATEGGVLLHTALRADDGAKSLLFLSPAEILIASTCAELERLFARIEAARSEGRYAAGYFTYEAGMCLLSGLRIEASEIESPLAWFGIYERPVTFNHLTGAVASAAGFAWPPPVADEGSFSISEPVPSLGEGEYARRVEAIHEHIRRGDCYQANLTFQLRFNFSGSPLAAYRHLIAAQPVRYAAYLNLGTRQVLSFSPELFFAIHGGEILARPMKGTARRGGSNEEDVELARWLRNDAKNRGENVMIVDLLRNDIGRIAEYGSVRAVELFNVEKYRTLLQMTSTVTGRLRPGLDAHAIFSALFPCGSITGAPKIQTMRILHELEGEPRGVYTGSIGYFGPDGEAEFNVAIRTLRLGDGRGSMGIGSGITIDSGAGQEYAECLLKARFLTHAEEPFSLLESILWDGSGFPLLALHMDRLRASARYFDFPFDEVAIRRWLDSAARQWDSGARKKLRLLVPREGEFRCEVAPLTAEQTRPIAAICPVATHSTDRFLRHKTTCRSFYERWLARARNAGFDEILFLNERGEVAEGAISNVFIRRNGRLVTPPVSCGALPGVFRRHLIEEQCAADEAVLTLEELKAAECIYFSNAIRGLREMELGPVLGGDTEADG